MLRSGSSDVVLVDGIEVALVPKNVKFVRMRVIAPDARVVVSVPPWASRDVVMTFIEGNREWIHRSVSRVRSAPAREQQLVDGGRARIWGEWFDVRAVDGARALATAGDGVIQLRRPEGDDEAARRAMDRLYERELRPVTRQLIEQWEPHVERSAGTLRFRRMSSRWGSCNPRTGAISINLALAERPVRSLEYVVVHELVHLREANHGPNFRAWMNLLLPDWPQRRRELKDGP